MVQAVSDAVDGVTNTGKSAAGMAWKVAKVAAVTYGALKIYGAFATGGTSAFADLAGDALVGLNEAAEDLTSAVQWGTEALAGIEPPTHG